MRYLTENNKYYIVYNENVAMSVLKNKPVPVIEAWIMDVYGNNHISDIEHWRGKLEPCLMKLGKRLIKKWQDNKRNLKRSLNNALFKTTRQK